MLEDSNSLSDSGNSICVHGAREHNLKNLTVSIPRGRFVVITGVSGSGKSTLAFDLLFGEGQRRFLDSMNAYARQFVEQLSRPDVDLITGLPPTVSIEQCNSRGGGKSTVATVTEIHHFLRLLFARIGTQFCPDCGVAVESQTRDQVGLLLKKESRKRGDLLLLAPVVKNRKGFHSDVADWAAKHGYAEIRADGKVYRTDSPFRLDRFREHDIEIVIGVFEKRQRKTRSSHEPQQVIDEALNVGHGSLMALDNHGAVSIHSTERACPSCHRSFEALDPKLFSYNSSQGWCPKCRGFGELFYLPEDVDRGARADAIEESWFGWQEGKRELCPECLGARLNLRARAVRWRLANQRSPLHCFESSLRAPGVRPSSGAAISEDQPAFGVRGLRASLKGAASGDGHTPVRGFKSRSAVSADALLQTAGPTIDNFSSISVGNAHDFFRRLRLKGREARIARDILPEIRERLKFLCEVGLGYLQLGRAVPTLSGGEAQRIRLAAQLGSNLSGVLYVLDEPTIGLHARDNEQLLATLKTLQSRGNSLVVVEHDEETMRNADYIVDLGPGAGARGGELVAGGTLAELLRREDSITGQSLRGQSVKNRPERGQRRPIDPPKSNRRRPSGSRNKASPRVGEQSPAVNPETTRWLTLHDATAHNLQSLTVEFPLNRFVVVTGVSGSGKSTLIRECLLPALTAALQQQKTGRASKVRSAATPGISGFEPLKSVYEVDQSPIGRTPRSTPATYVGFFDDIRQLFSQVPEARLRGYSASRFSYNSAQGRCPECEGTGTIKLEMSFLPPAFVRCETCQGLRFSRETLDIEFRGKNIAQVLDFGVAEAIEFFSSFQKIRHALEALRDTGLDYLKLGQTSPTLSGGEAQRVKLVTHLLSGLKGQPGRFDASGKRNMFILEEPTIGLHMSDVRRLVEVLQRLVDHGHSVIVIEHNLDLIAEADWIMDLGPEGGDGGGQVVATGTPEAIARTPRSHTGRFLRKVLAEK